jgi:Raf kinase inhibitor-like YbhB/YbcL family protein
MAPNFLRRIRAGESKLAWNHPHVSTAPETIVISSSAFADGTDIPLRHAGVGSNISHPLSWDNIPDGTAELVLIVEDPDAPLPQPFVHCVAVGIPPAQSGLAEADLGKESRGQHTLGKPYLGPAPVPGHGPHRYIFQLFALDQPLQAGVKPSKKTVLRALQGRVLARGKLTGNYER